MFKVGDTITYMGNGHEGLCLNQKYRITNISSHGHIQVEGINYMLCTSNFLPEIYSSEKVEYKFTLDNQKITITNIDNAFYTVEVDGNSIRVESEIMKQFIEALKLIHNNSSIK